MVWAGPTTPPQVTHQSPFEAFKFITELSSVSVEFGESVAGIMAGDLRVNGSPATSVTGSGAGPYVFTGFASPAVGLVTVRLASANIRNAFGLGFAGDSWTYTLIDPALDADADGVNDGKEVTDSLTNPTKSDTDADGLPDGFEVAHPCLDPLSDEAHPMGYTGPLPGHDDADGDGVSNLEEFTRGTDPCA